MEMSADSACITIDSDDDGEGKSPEKKPKLLNVGAPQTTPATAATSSDTSSGYKSGGDVIEIPSDDAGDSDIEVIEDDEDTGSSGRTTRRQSRRSPQLKDFELVRTLGKGGFGHVFLVRAKGSLRRNTLLKLDRGKFYAIKSIKKERLINSPTEMKHTLTEQRVLSVCAGHPFIVNFIASFQSPSRIFFVTELLNGGELFGVLSRKDRLSEKEVQFYLSELVLALEFLHHQGIIFRDLKPENAMIDVEGHIKLVDFGLSRDDLTSEDPMEMTFCGTKEYMAPEVFNRLPYNKTADWWSLGALAFDMMAGEFPFAPGEYDEDKLHFDAKLFSPMAKGFISKLLKLDPNYRLGSPNLGGANSIKKSSFFKNLNWNAVYFKRIEPPFIPKLHSQTDVKYFDTEFTRILPKLSGLAENGEEPNLGQMREFAYIHPDHKLS